MDVNRICDTVCKLASAGKRLPQGLPNGVDPYEGMCDAFCKVFKDRNIDDDTWNQAELNYIKGQAVFVSPQYMENEISNISQQTRNTQFVDVLHKGDLSDDEYSRRVRTACRLYFFTSRMFHMKIPIMDFLPSKEEAIAVGKKHGLTDYEMSIPTERGGQLLAVRAFMAEYYACKSINKPFQYSMAVNNHEVEWVKVK